MCIVDKHWFDAIYIKVIQTVNEAIHTMISMIVLITSYVCNNNMLRSRSYFDNNGKLNSQVSNGSRFNFAWFDVRDPAT